MEAAKPNPVYRAAWYVARFLLHALFGYRVEGAENVPQEGPVILAANHLSILDPIAIGAGVRRPVSFLARADVFRLPLLAWLLPRLYAIPVERGQSDLSAIKSALRALERGMAFGIFPEGTRSRTGKLQPFKTGVAAIALRTGSPVVPVAVIGTDKAWPVGRKLFRLRRPIRVVYGKPILVPRAERISRQELENLTREIEAKVRELLPPEYR
ncbi:1-acyl-sn-glycerol-3-phosphate acyltransferase [Thermus scotoductus]|uniref:1-acyl-sn-glycerol-3-phosphate acyltransferase n=1 Tax=Thermus scotoductus TaxID=37636 RepID=A0A430SBI2_THESC|nr:lysophospholipid acyltransferase family protein [Thermus scotoductus]RTG96067.1 1-acyl-sn-glycerol-3-phosphate acyltransferase [Thermus scotoductus]RTH11697.1 1-acyl-sn-glycerol-3-phosphate acyltransferase [Thermus scotoductus]RTH12351.1 1-acyl-sn-glycerol-3-phosphate acyltransferase [Thermus scotoductus]RTH13031.1 1-acyl-sn-glycerol-3-phosphate acyltransferase [Thermus scotoductus]RTH18842.1 1-acyl-sn-glycerol-3-phosphate acyltransferase [Thermus scotoductus]